ncbi:hypothetical protein StoSoilB13_24600 [Arthrobacter sp. StoSoilB13]|nr:hypothetical protein StoSoilB13_24600 [Arthrobacter sp. StoSoilB13]
MRVAGTARSRQAARSQQQDGMKGNHCHSGNRHLVKSSDAAVAPDVKGARHAHRRQGNHEDAKPRAVVSRGGEPQVDGA